MREGLGDSHMEYTVFEHRWEHIVVFRGSRPTRGPVRQLWRSGPWLVLWTPGYRDLFCRRARLVAPTAGTFVLAFLAGESTSGCETEARDAIKPQLVWRIAMRLAFGSQQIMSEGERGGIVELFFMPLGFFIKFVLCGIIKIV